MEVEVEVEVVVVVVVLQNASCVDLPSCHS